MITKLRKILSNDDEILEFYLEYMIDFVKAYCNIKEIPKTLENTIVYLTAEFYKQSDNKSSVSMGDISYTLQKNAIFSQYKSTLNRYRKVR